MTEIGTKSDPARVQDEPPPTGPPDVGDGAAAYRPPSFGARLRAGLSFKHISALYVFVLIFVIFSLWVPDTFLSSGTWRSLLDNGSLTALVAVGLVIPLAAGTFNLAIGTEVGMGAILVAWLLERRGVPVVPSVAIAIVTGALIGLVSGTLIVVAKIDSFIATLGVSSILLAMIAWISGSQQILDLGAGFQNLAIGEWLGITHPVFIMLVVAALVWYVLERTPIGRHVYATGGNIDAARLAGVPTARVVVASLVVCGIIAAMAGVLASSRLGTGDPTIGPSYLLPAFAAAFLGSTQFRSGRYNVLGTVVAVYVLATGVKGLQLAGAPVWIPDLFNGVALLIAVGMAQYQGTTRRAGAIRRLLRPGAKRAVAAQAQEDPTTLRAAIRPYVKRLNEELEETVDVGVLDGQVVRFIDQLPAPHRLRAVSWVGAAFALHATANGKALLAALPDERVQELLPDQLDVLTPNTITDRAQLLAELEQVRRDGVAYDREEHTQGICAVGAVVRDADGPVAVISVPVPAERFPGVEKEVVRRLREAAEECSRALQSTQAGARSPDGRGAASVS